MKYTITGILIMAAALLVWVWTAGSPDDTWMMLVAIVSVVFFGALGNLWNSLYGTKKPAFTRTIPPNAVVVRTSTFNSGTSRAESPTSPSQSDESAPP
jgi:lipoprotein signal peptidase